MNTRSPFLTDTEVIDLIRAMHRHLNDAEAVLRLGPDHDGTSIEHLGGVATLATALVAHMSDANYRDALDAIDTPVQVATEALWEHHSQVAIDAAWPLV